MNLWVSRGLRDVHGCRRRPLSGGRRGNTVGTDRSGLAGRAGGRKPRSRRERPWGPGRRAGVRSLSAVTGGPSERSWKPERWLHGSRARAHACRGDTWGGCRGVTERSGIRGPRPVSVGEGNGGGLCTVISRPRTGNKEGERID